QCWANGSSGFHPSARLRNASVSPASQSALSYGVRSSAWSTWTFLGREGVSAPRVRRRPRLAESRLPAKSPSTRTRHEAGSDALNANGPVGTGAHPPRGRAAGGGGKKAARRQPPLRPPPATKPDRTP